jgi:2-C-methyl-D-erythritol 4-phosphate cytidylyltransferase
MTEKQNAYCAILAAGIGTRMQGITNVPKQYMMVQGNPIISYTISTILSANIFNHIYIGVSEDYFGVMEALIEKHHYENVSFLRGGRRESKLFSTYTMRFKKNINLNQMIFYV